MAYRFKDGDKVLFYRKPYDSELVMFGTMLRIKDKMAWFPEIEEDVGKIGTVKVSNHDDRCCVEFTDTNHCFYIPNFLLKNIQEIRKEKIKRLIK